MAVKRYTNITVVLVCLMVGSVTLAQDEDEAESADFFSNLKEYLLKEFDTDFERLNSTWQAFREARDDLNATANATPWLTGVNNSVFNLTLLMEFKGKVMDMVDRKNEFLAQKALLRQEMYTALFNLSIRYYEELREVQSNRSSTVVADGGWGGRSEWTQLISTLFGSIDNDGEPDDNDDDNDDEDSKVEQEEVAVSDKIDDEDKIDDIQPSSESDDNDKHKMFGADTIIESFLSPYNEDYDDSSEESQSDESEDESESEEASDTKEDAKEEESPAYDWRQNPWTRYATNRGTGDIRGGMTNDWKKYAKIRYGTKDWKEWAKKGKDEWKKYAKSGLEDKKLKWKRYAMAREAEKDKKTEEMPTSTLSGRENAVIDISARLWEQFEPAIQSLNSTWNEFLTSKQEMVNMAAERAWETKSATGQRIFDPVALLEFKVKIRDMVLKKNQFVAEKVELKQAMVQELGLILQTYLSQQETERANSANENVEGSLFGDYKAADVIEPILEQLEKVEAPPADISTNGTGSNENIFDGLPFSDSLQLAAVTPDAYVGDDNSSGSGSSAEVVAVVTLGIVAVAVGAMLVAFVALRKAHRQSLYTRVG